MNLRVLIKPLKTSMTINCCCIIILSTVFHLSVVSIKFAFKLVLLTTFNVVVHVVIQNLCHFLNLLEVKPKPITSKTKTNCNLLAYVFQCLV